MLYNFTCFHITYSQPEAIFATQSWYFATR